jgi:hypothetical protein
LLAAPLLPDVLRCGAGGGSCQARLQIWTLPTIWKR